MPTDPTDTAGSADQDRITGSAARCVNCGEVIESENDPCYGHPDATPEWPVFHTDPA